MREETASISSSTVEVLAISIEWASTPSTDSDTKKSENSAGLMCKSSEKESSSFKSPTSTPICSAIIALILSFIFSSFSSIFFIYCTQYPVNKRRRVFAAVFFTQLDGFVDDHLGRGLALLKLIHRQP